MNPIGLVSIIGECMIELKKTNGQITQGFGGDTLNTAIYLSRLTKKEGITTRYVTGLGHDPFSHNMLTVWNKEGINTDLVSLSDKKLPGMYAIETNKSGERSFFYWRNDSAAKYWLRDSDTTSIATELAQSNLIYLSGISLAILPEDCRNSLIDILAYCRKKGAKIVFDSNYRPTLWNNATEAQHWYKQILLLTDIAFLTFDDEMLLWGDSIEEDTLHRTNNLGVKEIIIKRGSDACIVSNDGSIHYVAAKPVMNIIDTTAAGDSFSAGYLAKKMLGGNSVQSAESGHLLAGNVIQHHGAIISMDAMPTI